MDTKSKEKLDRLMEQQKQLQARIAEIQAKEKNEERKNDTRRKILIGGVILAKLKRKEWTDKQLTDLLDKELQADRDRSLFGLPISTK